MVSHPTGPIVPLVPLLPMGLILGGSPGNGDKDSGSFRYDLMRSSISVSLFAIATSSGVPRLLEANGLAPASKSNFAQV